VERLAVERLAKLALPSSDGHKVRQHVDGMHGRPGTAASI